MQSSDTIVVSFTASPITPALAAAQGRQAKAAPNSSRSAAEQTRNSTPVTDGGAVKSMAAEIGSLMCASDRPVFGRAAAAQEKEIKARIPAKSAPKHHMELQLIVSGLVIVASRTPNGCGQTLLAGWPANNRITLPPRIMPRQPFPPAPLKNLTSHQIRQLVENHENLSKVRGNPSPTPAQLSAVASKFLGSEVGPTTTISMPSSLGGKIPRVTPRTQFPDSKPQSQPIDNYEQ
jgi:hypothetical protein